MFLWNTGIWLVKGRILLLRWGIGVLYIVESSLCQYYERI
jgi:hypothetical protein